MMILLISATIIASPNLVQASSNNMIKETVKETRDVEIKKDDIRYVYKLINGKLYKRLYNYSKEEWIGDWILCK